METGSADTATLTVQSLPKPCHPRRSASGERGPQGTFRHMVWNSTAPSSMASLIVLFFWKALVQALHAPKAIRYCSRANWWTKGITKTRPDKNLTKTTVVPAGA